MNASSTQRYIFTSLDTGSNAKRARYSICKVNFHEHIISRPFTIDAQSRNDLNASSSFLQASYSTRVPMIIV